MNWRVFWGGFVFFALALGAGFGWFHFIRQDAQIKTYSTTDGTVLSAKMTNYTIRSRDSKGRRRTSTYYEPIMEYSYTVGGKKYTSASVRFGGGEYASTSREDIEKIVNRPVGSPITVFYNPDKPDESFLDKKASGYLTGAVTFALFTVSFGAAGIWMMLVGIKKKKRVREYVRRHE
ncbi:DUF3592 domain-containing protein [Breznakiellaceae bacterium SP9]